jgi:CBS domain-containing protein
MAVVSNHMTSDLLSVAAEERLADAAKRMVERGVGAVLVLKGESDSTEHAAALMIHGGFRHLPVLRDGRVAGIVSIRDLMRVALEDASPRGV